MRSEAHLPERRMIRWRRLEPTARAVCRARRRPNRRWSSAEPRRAGRPQGPWRSAAALRTIRRPRPPRGQPAAGQSAARGSSGSRLGRGGWDRAGRERGAPVAALSSGRHNGWLGCDVRRMIRSTVQIGSMPWAPPEIVGERDLGSRLWAGANLRRHADGLRGISLASVAPGSPAPAHRSAAAIEPLGAQSDLVPIGLDHSAPHAQDRRHGIRPRRGPLANRSLRQSRRGWNVASRGVSAACPR